MSGDIGLRIFQQLKSLDPEVKRDDYFNEEERNWDIDGLESDLKLAQERNTETSTSNAHSSVLADGQHHAHITPSQSNTHSTVASPVNLNTNPNASNTDNDNNTSHRLPIITAHDPQTATLSNNDQTVHHLAVQQAQATDVNLSEMPSPNGSPSIDYNDTEASQVDEGNVGGSQSLPNHNQHSIHINDQHPSVPVTRSKSKSKSKSPAKSKSPSTSSSPRKTRANRGGRSKSRSPSKKAANQKRKSVSVDVHANEHNHIATANQPPHKKQRRTYMSFAPAHAQWNEAALKKLITLKRSVKNSAWFWEPVDETKHQAPHYSLVCQMPSDFGTICSRLERNEYEHLDTFLRDAELVFINARMYNTAIHVVHRTSMEFEKKFKEAMTSIIKQYHAKFGSERTWQCWENAKKGFKPFAVPES